MQKYESAESTTNTESTETAANAEARVPFFARKAGRPNLSVRTGVRAGAAEEREKRR